MVRLGGLPPPAGRSPTASALLLLVLLVGPVTSILLFSLFTESKPLMSPPVGKNRTSSLMSSTLAGKIGHEHRGHSTIRSELVSGLRKLSGLLVVPPEARVQHRRSNTGSRLRYLQSPSGAAPPSLTARLAGAGHGPPRGRGVGGLGRTVSPND